MLKTEYEKQTKRVKGIERMFIERNAMLKGFEAMANHMQNGEFVGYIMDKSLEEYERCIVRELLFYIDPELKDRVKSSLEHWFVQNVSPIPFARFVESFDEYIARITGETK